MNWRSLFSPFKRLDPFFVLATLGLIGVGLLFIYSASYRAEEGMLTAMTRKQMGWALAGLAMMFAVARYDYRALMGHAWLLYAGGVVLLLLVLVAGVKVYGAYRWLNVFGIRVQPSEFAKLGSLIAMAAYLAHPSRRLEDPQTMAVVLGLCGLPFLLIMQQPDLGTAMTLLPMAFMLLFVAGVPLRSLLVLAAIGLALMPLGWWIIDDYQRERLLVFLDPGRDPLGAGWNKIQSEIAVGSGGLRGKGFLMGTQNILGFLPRTVAPTDFIFSVIAEESGFLGCLAVLCLYLVLFASGVRAAWRARDLFGRLLAVGMVSLVFSHVFVNVAMTIGMMPITGLPLPLISYGGSFMVTTLVGFGIIQSVYVHRITR